MKHEKRRYFRINDTVGVSYRRIDKNEKQKTSDRTRDVLELLGHQDEKIEQLLREVGQSSPKVAELARALNQKLERVVSQLVLDNDLMLRLAHKVKEVSISACGLGFLSDASIEPGARLELSIELVPTDRTVKTKGIVVGCDPVTGGHYWRIDFYDTPAAAQEVLIQHIVQRQSAQLKAARDTPTRS